MTLRRRDAGATKYTRGVALLRERCLLPRERRSARPARRLAGVPGAPQGGRPAEEHATRAPTLSRDAPGSHGRRSPRDGPGGARPLVDPNDRDLLHASARRRFEDRLERTITRVMSSSSRWHPPPPLPSGSLDASDLTDASRSDRLPPRAAAVSVAGAELEGASTPSRLYGKLQGKLWNCGKLNFPQIAGFPFPRLLRKAPEAL
jgi:hypothetical protein